MYISEYIASGRLHSLAELQPLIELYIYTSDECGARELMERHRLPGVLNPIFGTFGGITPAREILNCIDPARRAVKPQYALLRHGFDAARQKT